jgi:hypothetical protein
MSKVLSASSHFPLVLVSATEEDGEEFPDLRSMLPFDSVGLKALSLDSVILKRSFDGVGLTLSLDTMGSKILLSGLSHAPPVLVLAIAEEGQECPGLLSMLPFDSVGFK